MRYPSSSGVLHHPPPAAHEGDAGKRPAALRPFFAMSKSSIHWLNTKSQKGRINAKCKFWVVSMTCCPPTNAAACLTTGELQDAASAPTTIPTPGEDRGGGREEGRLFHECLQSTPHWILYREQALPHGTDPCQGGVCEGKFPTKFLIWSSLC